MRRPWFFLFVGCGLPSRPHFRLARRTLLAIRSELQSGTRLKKQKVSKNESMTRPYDGKQQFKEARIYDVYIERTEFSFLVKSNFV